MRGGRINTTKKNSLRLAPFNYLAVPASGDLTYSELADRRLGAASVDVGCEVLVVQMAHLWSRCGLCLLARQIGAVGTGPALAITAAAYGLPPGVLGHRG